MTKTRQSAIFHCGLHSNFTYALSLTPLHHTPHLKYLKHLPHLTHNRYIASLDRIVLGDKVSKRTFLNTSHVRKSAITTRVVQLVHEVLSKGIHITKRDLFYTDVKLFKEQQESDAVRE